VSNSRIKVIITVTNNFDPKLYEGLIDDPNDVEQAAAWQQASYDAGTYDVLDLMPLDQDELEVRYEGIKGDET
jgi:hypothetical protein